MSAAPTGAMRATLGLDFTQFETGARASGKIAGSMADTMVRAGDRVRQSVAGQAKSFDDLRASVDPAFASQQGYAALQRQLAAMVEIGAASQRAANIVLEQAASKYMGVETAAQRAARAQLENLSAVESATRSYTALRASLDPVYAASKRYEDAQEQLNAAVRAGVISQIEANRVLDMAEAKYLGLAPVAQKVAATADDIGKKTAFAAGGGVRMLGLQLSQVAQQGAVTGNYLGALAVQLPDMALGFGSVAIAASIVATVALPALINAFGSTTSAEERAADQLDALSDTLSAFNAHAELGTSKIDELRAKYGKWADEIQATAQWMAQVDVGSAMDELTAKTMTFSVGLDAVAAAQARAEESARAYTEAKSLSDAGMGDVMAVQNALDAYSLMNSEVSELASGLQLTAAQAIQVDTALANVKGAQNMTELAQRATEALDVIHAMYPAGALLPPELAKAAAELENVRNAAAQGVTTLGQMPTALGAATNAAGGLAGAMGQVSMAANAALAQMIAMDTTRRAMQSAAQGQAAAPHGIGPAGMGDGGLAYASQQARKLAEDAAAAARVIATIGTAGTAAGKAGAAGGAAAAKGMSAAEEAAEAAAEAAKTYADTMQGFVSDGIGSFIDEMVGGFKDGMSSIKDMLVDTIRQMIAFALKNKIMIAMGMSGPTSALASTATGDETGGGGILSTIGSSIGGIASAFGTGLMSVFDGVVASGLSGGLSAITTALSGVAGGGLAGLATAIGAIAGPIALIIGAVSLLRIKTKDLDNGLMLTVKNMDTLVQTFKSVERKFLWNSWGKTTWENVDKSLSDPISNAVAKMQTSIMDQVAALGIGTDAFAAFTYQMKVSTKGMDENQALAALQEAITGLGDAFAGMTPGLKALTKDGEGAMAALTRLSQSLAAVNLMSDTLGLSFKAVGLTGADMATQLADAFGGLDALKSSVNNYYAKFYTDAERTATATRQATDALAKLGAAMPTTRDQYRAMIEAQDLTTEAGRKLFAALVGMSEVMDQVLPQIGSFSAAIAAIVGSTQTSLETMITANGTAQENALQAAKAWYDTAKALRDYIADLRGTASELVSPVQALAANQARYEILLARSLSGDREASNKLTDAAGALLGNVRDTARTGFEAARAQAKVLADLQAAAGAAELSGAAKDVVASLLGEQGLVLVQIRDYLAGGGALDAATVEALNDKLGVLQDAITAAAAVNYASIAERIDLAVNLVANADIPDDLRALLNASVTALSSNLNVIVTEEGVTPVARWLAANGVSDHLATVSVLANTTGLTEAQKALLGLIAAGTATTTTGIITLGGAFTWDPSTGFQAWYEQATQTGISDPLAALLTPMETLRAGLAEVADAVRADVLLSLQAAAEAAAAKAAADLADAAKAKAAADAAAAAQAAAAAAAAAALTHPGGSGSGPTLAELAAALGSKAAPGTGHINIGNIGAIIGKLQGFASGGDFAGGLRIVGENGPELEATGPSRIYSAGQTARMLSGADAGNVELTRALLHEVSALRAEVASFRDQERQIGGQSMVATRQLLRLHESWDAVGLPTERVE